ncbi:MAG: DEAD/DEAH box helicase [Eubacteriales bacterium]|nr:DEAD/DEAH box helicase [Eubacteriales bacterium]
MKNVLFSEMSLTPQIERAISLMGFEHATQVQAEAIPAIRTGIDVIAKSQTGTGKTVAFAIPAIEKIDRKETKPTIQVLILCPTRELALQANEEIQKLTRFEEGIRSVPIYGGAAIDKQCINLRKANIVVGTPGRVMDHMRRKTIRLENLKMIVLDEADEMLNMGFREDIETILTDTPKERQTVLFSATMPRAIMSITDKFQNNPQIIEIDKSQVTLENISQKYIDVPRGGKKDSLALFLQCYQPNRAIIFCGTKRMADELTDFLNEQNISAQSIHSDIKQSRRTAVMQDFKAGKTTILIATDIAARGIDVNDIEYVINFDIPSNTEYYIHRIGRTGRAGKDGCSITLCSNKREINAMKRIAIEVKSEIKEIDMPTPQAVKDKNIAKAGLELEGQIQSGIPPIFTTMIDDLIQKNYSIRDIAEAALSLQYKKLGHPVTVSAKQNKREKDKSEYRRNTAEKKDETTKAVKRDYGTIVLNIGSSNRVGTNHIIGAIMDNTGISRKEINKVEISKDQSLIKVSEDRIEQVLQGMENRKICGKHINAFLLSTVQRKKNNARGGAGKSSKKSDRHGSGRFSTSTKSRMARAR